MAKPDLNTDEDLSRRLQRYRDRLEAEGRKRSLRIIDRAISDAMNDKRLGDPT